MYVSCILIGITAGAGWHGLLMPQAWAGMLCYLMFGAGAYFINAWNDVEIDRVNKPYRASVKGLVSRDGILTATFFSYFAAFSIAFLLGPVVFVIGITVAFLSVAYSLKPIQWKGRGALCPLTLVYTDAVMIVGGAAAVGNISPLVISLAIVQGVICFFTAFAKDIPDLAGDVEQGVMTLAARLGVKTSRRMLLPLPLAALTYVFIPKVSVLGPVLFVVFLAALEPLRRNDYSTVFKRGVQATIIENALIVAALLI
ncbi:MAG: UbiA family prenyltransferase [Candidatus Diapherotrites archaeon]|nr:UbiA family prenyltransferase [Candidatus Diapherotrites archaeon]